MAAAAAIALFRINPDDDNVVDFPGEEVNGNGAHAM